MPVKGGFKVSYVYNEDWIFQSYWSRWDASIQRLFKGEIKFYLANEWGNLHSPQAQREKKYQKWLQLLKLIQLARIHQYKMS